MPGQRSQFPAVGRLIKCKKNDRQLALIAELIEQRPKCVHIICWHRDVRTYVTAVSLIELAIVVARTARVNLHDQSVVEAHPRHFGQHLRAEEFLLLRISVVCKHATKELSSLRRGQIRGSCGGMPMVGCRATESAEADSRLSEGAQIAGPRSVFPGHLD